ncbi:MAG: cupin domain-containing protein [Candidatus Competibacter sp.]|nr:cupin domain-containing protein [Candidatus Competibacter sp.]MDG4583177.1 cupin domain-containing protein [Candidatus Competibacter sp.]
MNKLGTTWAIVLILGSTSTLARDLAPVPLLPDHIPFVSPPGLSGVQVAQILGDPNQPTPYLVRVKLAAGARIPPHTHPDARSSTVLVGTLYVGFGETFTESRVVAIPTGGVYVAPAGIPHYLWAKDGEAIYQEAGTGPTGVTFVKP